MHNVHRWFIMVQCKTDHLIIRYIRKGNPCQLRMFLVESRTDGNGNFVTYPRSAGHTHHNISRHRHAKDRIHPGRCRPAPYRNRRRWPCLCPSLRHYAAIPDSCRARSCPRSITLPYSPSRWSHLYFLRIHAESHAHLKTCSQPKQDARG